jgi:DNA-binding PadR family transcriptional regulator
VSVRHALLALLSDGPKYGMQLRDEYEAATGDIWPLNAGQVYTTLQRLDRDGLVGSEGAAEDDRQKRFRITAQGEAELAEWLRTPPGPATPPRDELVTKVLVATRVPGVNVGEVIQAHRRQAVELMQEWTRLKDEQTEFDLSFALVVDAELARLGGIVSWLNLADRHVKRAAEDPAQGSVPRLRRRVVVRQ